MVDISDSAHNDAPVDVGAQELARVYAESLLKAADRAGAASDVLDELKSLVDDVFAAQPRLEALFASRAVTRDRKATLIRSAFEGRAGETFTNFLYVLNQHDRLDLLRAIQAAAAELWNERTGRVPVTVTSAFPLEPAQVDQLKLHLQARFDKEPLFETKIDGDLLGGLIVQVGDWLYDASVRSRLSRFKKQLIESSSHEIQSGRDRFSSDEGN